MMRRWLICCGLLVAACGGKPAETPSVPDAKDGVTTGLEAELRAFVETETGLFRPLSIESARAWFEAATTGTDEAFSRSRAAENAVNVYLSDPARFKRALALRKGVESRGLDAPRLVRPLEVLYLAMLGKQVDPKQLEAITAIESKVEQAFNGYRGQLEGDPEAKPLTQNEINGILRTSTDSKRLEGAWKAQKAVGPLVQADLAALVKLRNGVAHKLGFRDFFALKMATREQDEAELIALFDRLDTLTRAPFLAAKAEVDRRLAKRYGIEVGALMPWHYQNAFFQEPPDVFATGLDEIYKQQDTLAVCKAFYEGLGLEVDAIITRSDLYEKPGKSPHAFAANIDREGDIRMLANIVPGLEWQVTMVHELGHAVYDQYIDRDLPWLLRDSTHPLVTEGAAMMLDRLVPNPHWLEQMQLIDPARRDAILPEAKAFQTFAPLQFSRWAQVMLRFERAMYAHPEQDLGKLWWDLVEKYQGLRRPVGRSAPDYASKIHVVLVPVYYHNYLLGDLFSAQVHEVIAKLQGKTPFEAVYVGDPKVGRFLTEKLFGPGALYRWDELTRRVTGKDLGPEAFARRFTGP